jgi:hypothetical protein
MTLDQFIKAAIKQKAKERDLCKDWLHKQIRMRINKANVFKQKQWKIDLVHSGVSLLPGDEQTGDIDCKNKIIRAIHDLESCYPLLEKELRRAELQCKIELESVLEKVKQNLRKSSPLTSPVITKKYFKEKWSDYNKKYSGTDIPEFEYPNIEQIDLQGVFDSLVDDDFSVFDLFVKIISDDSYKETIALLKAYDFKPHDLPKEDDIYNRCLGSYSPPEERIRIYLNPIYDSARIKGIDPMILFRKVLIHEMAHCLNHIGIDGDNKIWNDFGYRVYGKNTIEGLAQWYTYRYMYNYDRKMKSSFPINFLVTIWFSKFQSAPYQHYLRWHKYNYENLNRVLIEARRNTVLKEDSGNKFDRKLEENHENRTV